MNDIQRVAVGLGISFVFGGALAMAGVSGLAWFALYAIFIAKAFYHERIGYPH